MEGHLDKKETQKGLLFYLVYVALGSCSKHMENQNKLEH
jgi:hypothetical protein